MEFETAGLELKSAELEDAPHVRLEILHHMLVLDCQYPSGKHRIPMIHELDIHPVIAADVLDAVRELLAGREKLFVIAEAAGEGVSAGIDDSGVGQDEMNQPKIAKIVRHLVDEEGLGCAVDP